MRWSRRFRLKAETTERGIEDVHHGGPEGLDPGPVVSAFRRALHRLAPLYVTPA